MERCRIERRENGAAEKIDRGYAQRLADEKTYD
jgi:hypothetical protein